MEQLLEALKANNKEIEAKQNKIREALEDLEERMNEDNQSWHRLDL
tara:strand:- start:137 stop:274 length:138 start_codon:yes stop_codon:yes gene_type:complete